MVHSAQDQVSEGNLHLVQSLSPLRSEITAHTITSAVESARKRGKTPYSLGVNLITTQQRIAVNRCVVNRILFGV